MGVRIGANKTVLDNSGTSDMFKTFSPERLNDSNDELLGVSDYQSPNEGFFTKIDKYNAHDLINSNTLMSMRTFKRDSPCKKEPSERTKLLALPKKNFNGKDFFQRQEFRGLFLADH